ncbi:MAG: DUF5610 domain-containing protein [Planctomycetes bacterium]|nr:DUF5610 domain-containing protein [Planctomycetota bacterium]
MINNDMRTQLNNYLNNRFVQPEGNTATDIFKRLKARQDTIAGHTAPAEAEESNTEKTAAQQLKDRLDFGSYKNNKQTKTDEKDDLSPEERRRRELQAILDRVNAEEAAKYPSLAKKSAAARQTEETSSVITPENMSEAKSSGGVMGFLNDLPLFSEFKAGLVDAFNRLDSASAGMISAQYEFNYSSMQYIADAAGNFQYQETSFSLKFDLNYIKAAAGPSAKEIANLIGTSSDFASLIENLNQAFQGGQTQAAKAMKPEDFLASMKDYFSPEKTAGRIVDFATAFFPNSAAFKAKGDTEEARAEFAEMMKNAIQKGFDQAMGVLGKLPKAVQDDIDKTHELTFKGIDDFIKNGLNKQKQQEGIFESLQQFALSFEMSYSQKTVSVTNGLYTNTGQPQSLAGQATQPALDTQA